MKVIRSKFALIILSSLIGFAFTNCRSPGRVVERPRHGKTTEFHREPAKYLPYIYMNHGSRGVDRNKDVSYFSRAGMGLGLWINQPLGWEWVGHKFLYYYVDLDLSPERAGGVYPGKKTYTLSTYPGIMLRTYTPFFLKMHYGGGVNLRLYNTSYDRWGIYGKMGLEFFGLTASVIAIGHPGQSNWEREVRFGYIYAPIDTN